MKIIFLDIDGVLVTNKSMRAARLSACGPFERTAVANMNALIECTGAFVVLSSAWRTDRSLDMRQVLRMAGAQCSIVGQTPVLGGRGHEIAAWLTAHARVVKSFAILDDAYDAILCGRFAESLVSTTMDSGFDANALRRAMKILGGQIVSSADPAAAAEFTTLHRERP